MRERGRTIGEGDDKDSSDHAGLCRYGENIRGADGRGIPWCDLVLDASLYRVKFLRHHFFNRFPKSRVFWSDIFNSSTPHFDVSCSCHNISFRTLSQISGSFGPLDRTRKCTIYSTRAGFTHSDRRFGGQIVATLRPLLRICRRRSRPQSCRRESGRSRPCCPVARRTRGRPAAWPRSARVS